MTTIYKSDLWPHDLLTAIEQLKYWLDGAGVYMSNTQSGGIPAIFEKTAVEAACKEIASHRNKRPLHLMINNLPAETTVPIHTDTILNRAKEKAPPGTIERWHLPIKTNLKAAWWDDRDGVLTMLAGLWYGPMPFWLPHQVINNGTDNRIHLIVDLD